MNTGHHQPPLPGTVEPNSASATSRGLRIAAGVTSGAVWAPLPADGSRKQFLQPFAFSLLPLPLTPVIIDSSARYYRLTARRAPALLVHSPFLAVLALRLSQISI